MENISSSHKSGKMLQELASRRAVQFLRNDGALFLLMTFRFTFLMSALSLSFISYSHAQTTILHNAHSHNDYLRKRPLFSALEHGFFSVEADIHLVKGELLVAHIRPCTRKKRTLEKLYLEPLSKIVKENSGTVYPDGSPEFVLMIDFKSPGRESYEALRPLLEKYRDMLTVWENGVKKPGAVTILLSGGPPRDMMDGEKIRLAAYDGNIGEIQSNYSRELMPGVSSSYRSVLSWRGIGKMPEKQREKLHDLVKKAHAHNRQIRLYSATNRKKVWKELIAANVDWVNVDRLRRFSKWMEKTQVILDR